MQAIIAIHDTLDDTYGSPRLTSELRQRGFCANHKRIERLVKEHGLYARDARRKKVRTTIPDVSAPPLPDLVQRDFSVGESGRRTCGDITYIPTDEGWLYLADVEDLGSRRIVGYAMDDHIRTELVEKALTMAVAMRGGDVAGMIFHHDRGSQYMSGDFRKLCARHEIRQSVGRTGSCHDNAVAESFWATLKREFVDRFRFESRAEAKTRHHRLDQPLQRAASALVDQQLVADRVGVTLRSASTSGSINMCPGSGGKG